MYIDKHLSIYRVHLSAELHMDDRLESDVRTYVCPYMYIDKHVSTYVCPYMHR
jgi:hypothetical protein